MFNKLLFETRLGQWLLSQLEKRAGLAIVKADWLGRQETTLPTNDKTQAILVK